MCKANTNTSPLGRIGGASYFVERGVAFFKQGYNCSQSVALAFADYYEVPEVLMARMSASFGGGIGRMRETCGACCGMFLLAGLEVSTEQQFPNHDLKLQNYKVVQQLAADFRAETGSTICRELLSKVGLAVNSNFTPEVRTDEYYKKRPCIRMVETAIRTYYKYLENNSK